MTNPSSGGSRRCSAHKRTGEPCGRSAIRGGSVCPAHGGRAPKAKAKALVRAELQAWRLDDATEDPGDVLLRLVTQSARRVALYGVLLQRAYDAAERLAAAGDTDSALGADARRDLDAVLATGGVGALVGKTYGAAGKDGDIYATGEAIRGLAMLEAQERDRCANFAAKAVAAGLEERRVRLAERAGAALVALLDAVVRQLGHDPMDPAVREILDAELVAIEGAA